jgi:metal-responsive CopG/Arc/MetJ family transcriptional regulator
MATSKTRAPRTQAAKAPTTDERHIVQVRFPQDLLDAVDQEAARLSEERGGEPVGRSEVIRSIVRRALMTKSR